jgi:uncharacterized protein (TIGR00251 family)
MFQQTEEGVIVSLYVQANAAKSEIVGEYNSALKIKIKAPPVDGKANEEIIRFLSKKLKIQQNKFEFLKGDKSKNKRILIHGLSLAIAKELLGHPL